MAEHGVDRRLYRDRGPRLKGSLLSDRSPLISIFFLSVFGVASLSISRVLGLNSTVLYFTEAFYTTTIMMLTQLALVALASAVFASPVPVADSGSELTCGSGDKAQNYHPDKVCVTWAPSGFLQSRGDADGICSTHATPWILLTAVAICSARLRRLGPVLFVPEGAIMTPSMAATTAICILSCLAEHLAPPGAAQRQCLTARLCHTVARLLLGLPAHHQTCSLD